MDGNRRWARAHALEAHKGHERGAQLIEDLFQWCLDTGVTEVTLYTLSIQNLARERREVEFLLDLLRRELARLLSDERITRERVRVRFAGRRSLLPADIQERMREVEQATAAYEHLAVNFAICYGGREEIVDAVAALVADGAPVSEAGIAERLWVRSEPDLIIRTGAVQRTSNFLLWQSAYSEWVFLEKAWPEFTKADLEHAIAEFRGRDRRYGK